LLPGAPRTPELATSQLRADLEALAAPEMEGRRTGTPGGLRARLYVQARFGSIGLAPLDASGYVRPFAFEHRSIRALWRRDRPFRMSLEGANVAGRVPGTNASRRALLVLAHYDHDGVRGGELYPGADDNASGVAVLLALAAWAQSHPLRHDVVFASCDAEERGLAGARALLRDPGLERERLGAVLNMDMVGRPDNGLAIAGTGPHPGLRPLVETALRRSGLSVRLAHDRPPWRAGLVGDWTASSDHGPFAAAGFPWLYVGVEDHADYHAPGDTPDKVPPAFHGAVAELVLDLLRGLDAM